MKKLSLLVVLFTLVASFSASAQEIAKYDFEGGNYDGWMVWNKKTNEIVDANRSMNSNHAVLVTTAMHFGLNLDAKKSVYVVSADINPVWGEGATARVQVYNKEKSKFMDVTEIDLPSEKGFQKVEMKFKAKTPAHYRICYMPNGQSGSPFILDNVTITQIK